jgi:predicted O-methyltransferase YrrM
MEFDMSEPEWKPVRSGNANLGPNELGLPPNSCRQYRQWTTITRMDPHRMVGVGVMIRKKDLLAMGGWCNFVGRRGSQERGLALKAWMAGYDILVDEECTIGHEFAEQRNASRKRFPYPATSIQDWAKCQWHAWAVVLAQETFEREIMPGLLAEPKSAHCPNHHLEPHVVAERVWFAANAKKRSDEDLLDLLAQIRKRQEIPADTGGAELEPAALSEVTKHATGRCLEFGTGTGASAKAILASPNAIGLVSVDHMSKFSDSARNAIKDPRAMFLTLARADTGFYDVSPLISAGMKFDFVLIDGPPGSASRKPAIPAILPLLNHGAVILVDDAKRDDPNIQHWKNEYGVSAELLTTHRGLSRVIA